MKKLLIISVLLGTLAVSRTVAHAAYNASDILGQSTTDGVVKYTFGSPNNNIPFYEPNSEPTGVVVDAVHHRLFVTDSGDHRVLVFNLDSSNVLHSGNPAFVLGQPNFAVTTSGLSQNQLSSPGSLAYDSTNNRLFVADTENSRVMVFDVATITNGENAVNVLGQADFTTKDQVTSASGMYLPQGVVYDSGANRLFVADTNNNRVMVFDLSGGITNGMAAVNFLGQTDGVSNVNGGPEGHHNATYQYGMSSPGALAYDAANSHLFVADYSNSRVMVFDVATITNGENAVNLLGHAQFGDSGVAPDQSRIQPTAIAYDGAHQRLFVTDQSNNGNADRVMVFDVATITNGENAVNVLGQPNFSTSGASTAANGMSLPEGLDYDAGTNQLFLLDVGNNRVMVFDVTTITNGENAIFILDPNSNDRGFHASQGVAVDTVTHRVFVADTTNNRVMVFNLDASNQLIDHAADFVLGQPNFTSFSGGSGQNTLNGPVALVYDSAHTRLFVADTINSRVVVFNTSVLATGMNAASVLGEPNFTTVTGGTTQNTLLYPSGVTYDTANNRLFVADSANNRVMVFDVAAITNGENAVAALGQSNFTNNVFGLTQNRMSTPFAVAYDSTNNRLFVADLDNNRVLMFTAFGTNQNANRVLGQPDFVTGTPATTQSGMSIPDGLASDPSHNRLFVSDNGSNRVLAFDVATVTNGENAVNILGQDDYVSNVQAVTQSNFSGPAGLSYDLGNNRLYVADPYANRVMIFDFVHVTTTSLPNARQGAPYSQTLTSAGQSGTVTWTRSGALPNGLTLNAATGVISGTPTTLGTSTFTVTATDTTATGTFVSNPQTLSITVNLTGLAALVIGDGSTTPLALTASTPGGDDPTVTYDLTLASEPSAPVVIDVINDPILRTKDTVTIQPKQWNKPKVVKVKPRRKAQDGMTYVIEHEVTSADPAFNGLAIPDVLVTVTK